MVDDDFLHFKEAIGQDELMETFVEATDLGGIQTSHMWIKIAKRANIHPITTHPRGSWLQT